ncbi:MAG: exodeoxyribonuclease V subunit gamma [Cocleimonas sp.]|nr:exodeoxyribonuclease V subunit gamma [Cocleimonas sp.]
MLTLHSSNHLENLSQQFAQLVSTPLNTVFAEEKIVVQNAGMGRWLSMQMAQQLGISANYQYFFPAEYMWELLRSVIADIPQHDPSKPEVLRWRLASLFLEKTEDYPELAHYLSNDMAAWDLADTLAPVLDQYLFYRPDWITPWEAGEFAKDDWQARLWQRVIMGASGQDRQLNHWLDLQDNFVKHFADKHQEKPENTFSQRVSFFSVPALSPGYIRLLAELATKIDVHLFVMNPCREYWGDIESRKRQSKRPLEEQIYYDAGNGLLASLGKQGRDYIDQLHDLGAQDEESWVEPTRDTLLHCLQSDVLNLQQVGVDIEHITERQSVQFHSCHTPMREVEVLHDQILAALDTSEGLTPADIVVMTSNIDQYASYIEAVFATAEHTLPFSIADRSSATHDPAVEVFLKLLDLPEQRFTIESVFELLEYQEIRERFNLEEQHIVQCREWAQATNIRWGVSRKMRKVSGLPDTYEHSWKYGLDRMLLGYMMPGEQLFDNSLLLPFNEIEGHNARILSSFCSFTACIFQLWEWSLQRLEGAKWIEKLKALMAELFLQETQHQLVFNALDKINQQQQLAGFERTVAFSIIKKVIRSLLEAAGEERFMSRGITFCALVPMRSIPFKMIALLGMNDGDFPRQDQRHSFDKMAVKGRKGDRSRRDEDRYLFLESILAARQRLYISYIGQSVQDNSSLPPSVVVSELLDYLTKMTGIEQQHWICQHPLQAFSARYYATDNDLFTYVKEYLSLHTASSKKSSVVPFISKILPEPHHDLKHITLEQLTAFYKSPARAFLQQCFSIQVFDTNNILPMREPFGLEPFIDTKIRQQVASMAKNKVSALNICRAKGLLPHGDIGDEAFSQEEAVVQQFYQQYPKLLTVEETQQSFHLQLGDFVLTGKLSGLTKTVCVKQHLGTYYAGDLLTIWLHHLVMNSVALDATSITETEIYQPTNAFTLAAIPDATALLTQLLEGYWRGLQQPLHFFAKPAYKMYEKGGGANISAAELAWNNDFYGAESDRFEHQLLFSEKDVFNQEFFELAEITFGRMTALSVDLIKD